MADIVVNNIDTRELAKILNPNFERNESELENLIDKLEDAREKGTDQYVAYLSNEVARMTEIVESQKEAAEGFYNDMVRISGGRTDLDKEMLGKIYTWMVEYSKTQKEIADLKSQLDSERHKSSGKYSKATQAEKKRLNDEIRKKEAELTAKKDEMMLEFGKNSYANKAAREFVSKTEAGERNRERIERARIAADEANETRLRRLEEARARRENEQAMQSARDMWTTIKAMWTSAKEEIKKGGNMWLDFNAQAISDAKRLGMTSKDQAMAYTETLIEKTQTLSRNFAMSRDEAMKMQEAYAKVTGRATLLTQEQMSDIAAASKLMGQETVMNAIQMMDNMGTTSQTAVELLDSTYARARNAGIDINKATEIFVKNLSLANKLNFRDGVDGISRMAVYSQKIKMDMQEIGNIAEHFSSIEDAIQNSARLQMLGGAGAILGGNPMEMMFEALADPEALQKRVADIFADQAIFNRATGQAIIAPMQQAIIREQAKALGMNPDEAVQTAKRQAEIGEIESDLMRYVPQFYNRLSESERDSIINKAQYDKETQSFYVNYRDEKGKEQRVDIKDISRLTEEEFKSIAEQVEPVEDIRDNVRKIAEELVGTRERWNSMKDQVVMGYSRAMHEVMKIGDSFLTAINSSALWRALTTTIQGAVSIMVAKTLYTGVTTYFAGKWSNSIINSIATRNTGGSVGAGVSGRSPIGRSTNTTRGSFSRTMARNGIVRDADGRINSESVRAARNAARNNRVLGTASKVGTAVGVAAAAWQGYEKYSERNELASEKLKTSEDVIKYMESKQGQIVDTRRAYSKTEIERMRTQAKNRAAEEKAGAVGSGVGTFGGALAGGLAGAKIGGMIGTAIAPGVGTFIGGAIGGVIGGVGGAFLGDKYGKEAGRQMASTKGDDIINKHLNEINKGDVEDNFRKIVLPVESIDYNVSLIANQLGVISAKPSMGNIYLESEIEAVKRGENPVEIVDGWQPGYTPTSESGGIFYDTSVRNGIANNNEGGIGGVKVNKEEIKKQIVTEVRREIASSYDKTQNGKFELTVNGSIDLNLAGTNVGKIGPKEFQQMLNDNPQIMRELSSNVFKELVSNGTGSYKLLSETQYSNRSNIPGSSEYGSITG